MKLIVLLAASMAADPFSCLLFWAQVESKH